jgi:hypothetical protein
LSVYLVDREDHPALQVTLTPMAAVDPQSRDLAITPDGTRVEYEGDARVDRTFRPAPS